MTEIATEVLEASGHTPADMRDAQADVVRDSFRLIDRFVFADTLPAVYKSYGAEPYDGTDRRGALAHAEQFGNRYLDWRQGTPRRRNAPVLPQAQERALVALGEQTNMSGTSNAHDQRIDVALIQGSYKAGIWQRTDLAADQWWHQHLASGLTPQVFGLGIERLLTAEDTISPVDYGEQAKTEAELIDAAIERQFRARHIKSVRFSHDENGVPYAGSVGTVKHFRLPNGDIARTLNAPKVEGRDLPNTADTHRFAVRVIGKQYLIGKTLLGTTTQIYEPFQWADMLRVWGIRYGARIAMAGYHDPDWTQPAHIGQELNSFFDQATLLMNELEKAELTSKE